MDSARTRAKERMLTIFGQLTLLGQQNDGLEDVKLLT